MSTRKNGIGYSPISEKIYLGIQDQKKGMWVGEKHDVTHQFIGISYEYFKEGQCREIESSNNQINMFLNVKKDIPSIEKTIDFLTKELERIKAAKDGE